MSKLKLIGPMIIAIIFVVVGFYLIRKQDNFSIVVGYANIFFWSAIVLVTFYKLALKKQ